MPACNPNTQMKNTDYSFKIVAAVVLAGVVVAFASPAPVTKPAASHDVAPPAVVHAAADLTDTHAAPTE